MFVCLLVCYVFVGVETENVWDRVVQKNNTYIATNNLNVRNIK